MLDKPITCLLCEKALEGWSVSISALPTVRVSMEYFCGCDNPGIRQIIFASKESAGSTIVISLLGKDVL